MPSPAASFGQLDSSLLEDRCRFFLAQGLAQSTQKSCASGQRRFIEFCRRAGKLHPDGSPCPSFSSAIHLSVADIAVDSSSLPSCLRVRIKASKTDPFRKGCFVHIGRGTLPLCAVHAVLAYLSLRGNSPVPLFLLQNGQLLSRTILTDWLRQIMSASGIPGNFSSHSFRIGAASVAARNGVPDHLIQALGRWSSNAYKLYIRTPSEYLAGLSHCLT